MYVPGRSGEHKRVSFQDNNVPYPLPGLMVRIRGSGGPRSKIPVSLRDVKELLITRGGPSQEKQWNPGKWYSIPWKNLETSSLHICMPHHHVLSHLVVRTLVRACPLAVLSKSLSPGMPVVFALRSVLRAWRQTGCSEYSSPLGPLNA